MKYYSEIIKNNFLYEECTSVVCPFHVHGYIEIICVKSGSVSFKINESSCRAEKGNIIIIFPDKIHSFTSESCDLTVDRVLISPTFLKSYGELFEFWVPVNPIIDKNAKYYIEILTLFNFIKNDKTEDNIIKSGYCLSLTGLILKCVKLEKSNMKKVNYIEAILNYCNNHYKENLTTDSIANALFISRSYVSYIFKNEMHINFREYINMLRVSSACLLIKSGTCSITDVAYNSGFDTTRTFNRVFLKIVGKTPTEYKRCLNVKS